MLTELRICNIGLIDTLEIDFKSGLTILSGETGSGKSMILSAIGVIMGNPLKENQLKQASDSGSVEGYICLKNHFITKNIKPFLDKNKGLRIIKKIRRNKSSITRINDIPVSNKCLKECVAPFIQFSGQHAAIKLLSSSKQQLFLQQGAGPDYWEAQKNYEMAFDNYTTCTKELTNIQSSDIQKRDFIEFQLAELNKASLKHNEEENLLDKKRQVKNHNLNAKTYKNLLQSLYQQEQLLSEIKQHLDNIQSIKEPDLKLLKKEHQTYYITCQDAQENLSYYLSQQNHISPQEIDNIEKRLDEFFHLKQKYRVSSIEQLINKKEKLQKEFDLLANSEAIKKQLVEKQAQYLKTLQNKAVIFQQERNKHAKILSDQVTNILKELHFKHAQFCISFTKRDIDKWQKNNPDDISFMIALNPGQALKPIQNVASGGELSRIQLALQSIFSQSSNLCSIIFDEIDSGIGGYTAISVAKHIQTLSKKQQVFVVTHLPQIAQTADHHLYIEKNSNQHNSQVSCRYLNSDDQEKELSRMVGGINIKHHEPIKA